MILNLVILPPSPGDIWQGLQTFLAVLTGDGIVPGIQWVEAREAAQHSTVHRTASTEKNSRVDSVGAEKPWSGRTLDDGSCCASHSEMISALGECTALGFSEGAEGDREGKRRAFQEEGPSLQSLDWLCDPG